MTSRFILLLTVLAGLAAGCGNDNPVAPGYAPAPDPPELSCPSDLTETGVTGISRVMTYTVPPPSGGLPPVTSSCSPASGSAFPIGTTLVTCVATDSVGQRRTCAFSVTLTPLRLNAVTFLAFGDSLTEGQNGNAIVGPCSLDAGVQCVDTANAYPTVLARLLKDEFPTQNVSVVNAGIGGERVEEGLARLPGVLAQQRPDALLLLEGFNNLGRDGASGVSEIVDTLRRDIRVAKQAEVAFVFVSTLTPPGPGFRALDRELIEEVNAELRRVVPIEGAILVDSYPLFLGRESTLIASDGLHLTPAGNQVLAESFFTAIRSTITAARVNQPSAARTASAISSAHACTDACVSPSIITRSSGSVPE